MRGCVGCFGFLICFSIGGQIMLSIQHTPYGSWQTAVCLIFLVLGLCVFRIIMNYDEPLPSPAQFLQFLVCLGCLGCAGYSGFIIYPIIKSHPVITSLGLSPDWHVPLHFAVVLLFVVLGFGVFRIIITAIERLKPKSSGGNSEYSFSSKMSDQEIEMSYQEAIDILESGDPDY